MIATDVSYKELKTRANNLVNSIHRGEMSPYRAYRQIKASGTQVGPKSWRLAHVTIHRIDRPHYQEYRIIREWPNFIARMRYTKWSCAEWRREDFYG
jgi:hypothetical protein